MGESNPEESASAKNMFDFFSICSIESSRQCEKKRNECEDVNKLKVETRRYSVDIDPQTLKARLCSASLSPSWKQDPVPLPGWSVEDQRKLIDALSKLPETAKRNAENRHTLFGNLIRPGRPLAGKTLAECESCFQYVQRKRIAFFSSQRSLIRSA